MEKEQIVFKGYSIKKFSMEKKPNIPSEQKNTIEIKYNAYSNDDKKKKDVYCTEMKIKTFTENTELYIEFDGFFDISEKLDEASKKYFLEVSAASIIYPYIRAFISNATALDTGNAVILPVINFASVV